jgi:pimeloyl-ACP methyl ester carboxylesterase
LVLVHGFSLDCRMWDEQAAAFSLHYQVLRYDLRGFGRSALPGSQTYHHEADLSALLDYLDLGRVNLIGLSLGGMVAVDFALTYPERVRTLILVDALFNGFNWSEEWDTRTGLVWQIGREQGIAAAKDSWLHHPLFEPCLEQPAVAARLTQMIMDYSGWHFVNHNPAASPKPPAAERLNQIKAPTLTIVGARDLPDFQHMADAVAREVSGARKVVLPKVGHMSNMEAPEPFNDVILHFLENA